MPLKSSPKIVKRLVRKWAQKCPKHDPIWGPKLASQANVDRGVWKALGPRMPPKWLKMARDGPRSPKDGPKGPKIAPRWGKLSQDGPILHQQNPKIAQDGSKMSQEGPKMAQYGPDMAQDGPSCMSWAVLGFCLRFAFALSLLCLCLPNGGGSLSYSHGAKHKKGNNILIPMWPVQ